MKKLIVVSIVFLAIACADIAVDSAPKKKVSTQQSEFAQDANSYFWKNFHAGNYDSIPVIIAKLNIALALNPNDLVTTAHLGFTHIWALSERQNLHQPNPAIVEHVHLARRYFEETHIMNNADPRITGFLADMTMEEGSRLANQKEQTEGYFMGLKSIHEWPQFNKFTVGYSFAGLDTANKNFKQGLEWQYESMDDCACELPNVRDANDSTKTAAVFTSKTAIVNRACADTWIAPHNLEGFFLNLGDMLVKQGKWQKAIRIYGLARLAPSYQRWVYKDTLEARVLHARENVAVFNRPVDERNLRDQPVIMSVSGFSCMGCHRMSPTEQVSLGVHEPPLSYYFLTSK